MLVMQQRRATVAISPISQVPGLGGPDKGIVEERREGLRVEALASADCQTALPGRESDLGHFTAPAGHDSWKDGHFGDSGGRRGVGGARGG